MSRVGTPRGGRRRPGHRRAQACRPCPAALAAAACRRAGRRRPAAGAPAPRRAGHGCSPTGWATGSSSSPARRGCSRPGSGATPPVLLRRQVGQAVHPARLRAAVPHPRRADPRQEPAPRRRAGGAGSLGGGGRRAGRRPGRHRRSARAARGAVGAGGAGGAARARRRSGALGRAAHRVPARRAARPAGVARRCAARRRRGSGRPARRRRAALRRGRRTGRRAAPSRRVAGAVDRTSSPTSRPSGGGAAATASASGSATGSASIWSCAPRARSPSIRTGSSPISSSPARGSARQLALLAARRRSPRRCGRRPGEPLRPSGCGGGRVPELVEATSRRRCSPTWGAGLKQGYRDDACRGARRGRGTCSSPAGPASGSSPDGAWLVHAAAARYTVRASIAEPGAGRSGVALR